MNGVHDMGGMQGLGPIAPEPNEPIFHEPWEARALALVLAAGANGRWSLDAMRHQRELIPGAEYLRMSYYEKWIAALEAQLVASGLLSAHELKTGRAAAGGAKASPPLTADRVQAVLSKGGPSARPMAKPGRFALGERVRARTVNPVGHTRLPRYARGRVGLISRLHGPHVFPDANAHGLGERPQPLYQVRFEACDLWGSETSVRGAVYLDLWEDYLEEP